MACISSVTPENSGKVIPGAQEKNEIMGAYSVDDLFNKLIRSTLTDSLKI